MFCSVPMVYAHISSRKRANKQMSTNILQRWILRNIIEQLIMTKSSVKFNPENDINVKLQIFNFTFHAITSISSIRICHEHQRLEFIYHTPFIFSRTCDKYSDFFNRGQLLTQQSFSMWFATWHTTYYGFLLPFWKMRWCRSFNSWE